MRVIPGLLLCVACAPAWAGLEVFACTPDWGAPARELGGDRTSVYTATTALQDPHRIEARPSLIARARRADLVVCTGADLEIGWLPLALSQSGNPKIQSGQRGYFEAASAAELIERPSSVDCAMGDVHAAYSDLRAADWLAQQAKLPSVLLPFTVGGTARAADLFTLYDDTIERLLAGAR